MPIPALAAFARELAKNELKKEAKEITGINVTNIKPESGISMKDAKQFINDNLGQGRSTNKSEKSIDSEKKSEKKETESKCGGSYGELKNDIDPKTGENLTEKHHCPPDSVNGLETNDGPCVKMDIADHRQTASFGNSREAQQYRAEQKALIEKGDFRGAMERDIQDIQSKFGDKYDSAIQQMSEFADAMGY